MSDGRVTRGERLVVRLTAEESACVADLAAARGSTISDLIRETVLQRAHRYGRLGRRTLPDDLADTVRRLTAIGLNLRELVGIARADALATAELEVCLTELRATLVASEPS